MGKVLMVVGDAVEVFDTLYPIYRVREDGFECDVAGPEKQTYHMVLHERPDDWDITQETAGYKIEADIAFRDINPADYTGILISGGRAPEYIRYDEDLLNVVRYFAEAGLPVGSVCHGIEVLAKAGVIDGKRVTTVEKCKFDAEVCGGTFVNEPVVISGNIITARTWHDNAEWMREFMRQLNAAELGREKVA